MAVANDRSGARYADGGPSARFAERVAAVDGLKQSAALELQGGPMRTAVMSLSNAAANVRIFLRLQIVRPGLPLPTMRRARAPLNA